MADTPTGETVTPEAPSNEATPPATPVVNADAAEVERLKKEAEQARMRANQLQNQLDQKAKEEEEATRQKLEEENQYKSLYEQEKAKREAFETEQERNQREAELARVKQDALKDYPEEVRTEAEELGIDLSDASNVDAYKARLDKLNARYENANKVTPNNGRPSTNTKRSKHEILQDYASGNSKAFDEALSSVPFISQNTEAQ